MIRLEIIISILLLVAVNVISPTSVFYEFIVKLGLSIIGAIALLYFSEYWMCEKPSST